MKLKILTLLFIGIISQTIKAQLAEEIKGLFDEAREFILSEDYTDALYALLDLDKAFPSENCDYLIGECYLNIPGRKHQAVPYLESAIQHIDKKFYVQENPYEKMAPLRAYYLLGKAYRINNQLDKAIETFNILLDLLNEKETTNRLKVAREIEICNYAKIIMRKPLEVNEKPLPKNINNKFANFNAVTTPDFNHIYYMNAFKFYDGIMGSDKVNDEWENPSNLSTQLGSDGDQYVVSVSSDGNALLFKSFKLLSENDIYYAKKQEEGWSPISAFENDINSNFVESHASFSHDGNTIYFTSNRPGGYGGLDIYSAQKQSNGSWGNIKNLGESVNSPYDEDTPFITEDGNTLFFSSRGHDNMGEYDVFTSTRVNNEWTKPKNIGYPLNNTDDNRFYLPLKNGKQLLYSRFSDTDPDNLNIYLVESYSEKEYAAQEETTKPFVENNITEQQQKNSESTAQTKPTTPEKTSVSTQQKTKPATVPKQSEQTSLNTTKEVDTIYLANIYFSPEKYYLDAKLIEYLDYIEKKISRHHINAIELKGFSNFGHPGTYGEKLAYYRCLMVKNYLISEGISQHSFNITQNTNKNSEDEYNTSYYNRRVEINFPGLSNNIFIVRTDKVLESH